MLQEQLHEVLDAMFERKVSLLACHRERDILVIECDYYR